MNSFLAIIIFLNNISFLLTKEISFEGEYLIFKSNPIKY